MEAAEQILPLKRKRGRPRKDGSEPTTTVAQAVEQAFDEEPVVTPEQIALQEAGASEMFIMFVMVMHRALTSGDEFQMKPLHQEIFDFLDDAYEGRMLYGYINIPPRHGKSYLMALWIAWCYGRHPDSLFIYTTYAGELAETTSMLVQRVMSHPKYAQIFPADECRINPKVSSRAKFQTMRGGEMVAVGIEGTVTGKGAGQRNALKRFSGAIIFDDLHKPGEAASEPMKYQVKKFYEDTLSSRQNNNRRVPIIGIGQRVALDDIFGMLDPRDNEGIRIGDGRTGLTGRLWTPLVVPARGPDGKAIYPEVKSTEDLDTLEKATPWLYWTQYQQRPYNEKGTMFKVDMMTRLGFRPAGPCIRVRAWDLAARKLKQGRTEPDYTACCLLAYYFDSKQYVIEEAFQFRDTPDKVRARILNCAHRDGVDVIIRLPQDPGQAGVDQVQSLTEMLNGYKVRPALTRQDKAASAEPVASQLNVGLVSCLDTYYEFVKAELLPFPDAKHDDFVDAFSGAYAEIAIPDEDEASRRRAVANLVAAGKYEFGEGLTRELKEGTVVLRPGYFPGEEEV